MCWSAVRSDCDVPVSDLVSDLLRGGKRNCVLMSTSLDCRDWLTYRHHRHWLDILDTC